MTTDAARLQVPPGTDGASFVTRLRRRKWFPYVMTVPAVLVVVAVVIYPMAYFLFVSFTDFHLLRPDTTSQFVPAEMFDNATPRLARDDVFWKAVVNTLIFMAVTVYAALLIGFGLAMLLARMTFAMGPVRVLLMIPMMFAPVLVGFQFAWFFNATVGLVNNALLTLGLIARAHRLAGGRAQRHDLADAGHDLDDGAGGDHRPAGGPPVALRGALRRGIGRWSLRRAAHAPHHRAADACPSSSSSWSCSRSTSRAPTTSSAS